MRYHCCLALLLIALSPTLGAAASTKLASGPMLGYTTMAEVLIWVQTTEPATVVVEYAPLDAPAQRFQTDPVETAKHTGFVAKCIADKVRSDTTYQYRVLIDGAPVTPRFRDGFNDGAAIPLRFSTPPNWRFREDGHRVPDFTIAFGSCAYQNEPGGYDRLNSSPYGAEYQIFESIYTTAPDLFIWLGDNVYYREADWTSRTGMIHRWSHDRSNPHLRGFLATIPQYATWDDHDYGPNDATRDFWNKATATEIFTLFHGNPSAGLPETPGIFTFFNYGDVNVALLDNRTYRTVYGLNHSSDGTAPQMLGRPQIDWLVETLKYRRNQSISSYPSTFNLIAVGHQIIPPRGRDAQRNAPDEWSYLFRRLVEEEIHNVIFITGDVHFGEVSKLTVPRGAAPGVTGVPGDGNRSMVFHEVTASPLTAGPWAGAPAAQNPHRLDIFPGEPDRVGQRNFASLSFEGPLHQRSAVIRFYDSDGRLLNQLPGAAPGTVTPESIIPAVHTNLAQPR